MTTARDAVFESFSKQYEQFGAIRLRRYNDLLGGEIEEYERQNRESAQVLLQINEMAKAIGEHPDSGMTADEALALLSAGETDTALKISIVMKWGPPGGFGSVAAVMPAQQELNTRMITLVVNARGTVKVGDEWLPLEGGWSEEDSRGLPGKIRQAIIEFISTEALGGEKKAAAGKPPAAKTPEPIAA